MIEHLRSTKINNADRNTPSAPIHCSLSLVSTRADGTPQVKAFPLCFIFE